MRLGCAIEAGPLKSTYSIVTISINDVADTRARQSIGEQRCRPRYKRLNNVGAIASPPVTPESTSNCRASDGRTALPNNVRRSPTIDNVLAARLAHIALARRRSKGITVLCSRTWRTNVFLSSGSIYIGTGPGLTVHSIGAKIIVLNIRRCLLSMQHHHHTETGPPPMKPEIWRTRRDSR